MSREFGESSTRGFFSNLPSVKTVVGVKRNKELKRLTIAEVIKIRNINEGWMSAVKGRLKAIQKEGECPGKPGGPTGKLSDKLAWRKFKSWQIPRYKEELKVRKKYHKKLTDHIHERFVRQPRGYNQRD